MLKKTFLKHEPKNEQMALQITSMADVFVIILVFLLKSYSIEGLPYEPSMPLNPPAAAGNFDAIDGLKVEISAQAVAVAGKPIASMKQFRFAQKDLDSEGTSQSLRRALSKARSEMTAKGEKKELSPGRVIVVADESAPYETIKTVLTSAAYEGFSDVQLAVSHAN